MFTTFELTIFFNLGAGNVATEQTLDNLCGDLNKGYLPLNPTGQNGILRHSLATLEGE